MKQTLHRLLKSASERSRTSKLTRMQVIEENDAIAMMRTNIGSKSMDYTTTMEVSPKPAAKNRYLGSLP